MHLRLSWSTAIMSAPAVPPHTPLWRNFYSVGEIACDSFSAIFRSCQIHPRALTTAEAAEAAGEQHCFWEMHGILFQHQTALEGKHLVRYAAHLGMDILRFTDALAVQRHRDRVQADFVTGMRSGVHDTPALFINGIGYAGSFDVAAISAAIKGNIGVGRYDLASFTRKAPTLSAKQGRK